MDRDEILEKLKEEKIVYGKQYTVQAMYLWLDTKGKDLLDDVRLNKYAVCKNEELDVYEDGSRIEMVPFPIKYFEIEDIEEAVEKFIELETAEVQ